MRRRTLSTDTIVIAPSVLASDFANLGEAVQDVAAIARDPGRRTNRRRRTGGMIVSSLVVPFPGELAIGIFAATGLKFCGAVNPL